MKANSVKEKFIVLRAEGLSFDKIAKRIKVSKPTLIKWQREYQKEINELLEVRYGEILEKYKLTKEKRIEKIAEELELVWEAYKKVEYKDLTKRELLMMIMRLERRLKEEIGGFEKFEEEEEGSKEYKIQVIKTIIGEDGKEEDFRSRSRKSEVRNQKS